MTTGELKEKDRNLATWRTDDPDAGVVLTLSLKDTWDLVLTDGTRGRAFKAHYLAPVWHGRHDKLGPISVPPRLRGWLASTIDLAAARVETLLHPIRKVPMWP